MKISYISGTKGRATVSQGNSTVIGSLDWAGRVGLNLSTSRKIAIVAAQANPAKSVARGIIRELISGNRGGIADMLYGMSPFNTEGKIDKNLENQYLAARQEINTIAQQKYPVKARNITVEERNALRKKYPNVPPIDLNKVEDPNYKAQTEFIKAESKKAYQKFPYLVYPPSDAASQKKYRELEIQWLDFGGNVDTFNAAVKEGVTKSPRSIIFNYLLGKFAAKKFRTQDYGLAIRAVLSAGLGGARFNWTDKEIFNPWAKRIGTAQINGISAVDPASGGAAAGTATAVAGSAKWWAPYLEKLINLVLSALGILIARWAAGTDQSGNPNVTPQVDETGGGGSLPGPTDLTQYALPIGAAIAAYLLLFNDDKK